MSPSDIVMLAPQHHDNNTMFTKITLPSSRTIDSTPPPPFLQQQEEQPEQQDTTSAQNGSAVLFPWKLHEMLDAAESAKNGGFTSVVSWVPNDPHSFRVHDKEAFVSLILPQYFADQTKYKSFQRQLNLWGFKRHRAGASKGGYTHPCLVRGHTSLCCHMKRSKKAGGGVSATSESDISTSQKAIRITTRKSSSIVPRPSHVGSKVPMTSMTTTTTTTLKSEYSTVVSLGSDHEDEPLSVVASLLENPVKEEDHQPQERSLHHHLPKTIHFAAQQGNNDNYYGYKNNNKKSALYYDNIMDTITQPKSAEDGADMIFEGMRFFPIRCDAENVESSCW